MKTNKTSLFQSMIYGNKLVLVCVFFTMATVLDVVLCTINGWEPYTSFKHLTDRLIVCSITVLPLMVFKHFEKWSVWAVMPIYYVLSCGFTMLNVFVNSFFYVLHPDAYRDQFRAYNIMFWLIILGVLVIDLTRTALANRALRKISSQGNK
jgi:hypothetical protein